MRISATLRKIFLPGMRDIILGALTATVAMNTFLVINIVSGGHSITVGYDVLVAFVMVIVVVSNFRGNINFTYQNSLGPVARSLGIYLSHVLLGLFTGIFILVTGKLIPMVLDRFGVSTNNFLVLGLFTGSGINWANLNILLTSLLLLAVVFLLMALITYQLKGWQVVLFWLGIYVTGTYLVGLISYSSFAQSSSNLTVNPFVDLTYKLVVWLKEADWHLATFFCLLFALVSLVDLLVLYRLQLRKQ